LEIRSHDPGHAHIGVILWMQGGSVLYACTKFEADRSFHSTIIKVVAKISNLGHVILTHVPFEPETLSLCTHPPIHTCCQILCF